MVLSYRLFVGWCSSFRSLPCSCLLRCKRPSGKQWAADITITQDWSELNYGTPTHIQAPKSKTLQSGACGLSGMLTVHSPRLGTRVHTTCKLGDLWCNFRLPCTLTVHVEMFWGLPHAAGALPVVSCLTAGW
jgi:hypothetical protein